MSEIQELIERLRNGHGPVSKLEAADALERMHKALEGGVAILDTVPMAVKFADDRKTFDALSDWVDTARRALNRG